MKITLLTISEISTKKLIYYDGIAHSDFELKKYKTKKPRLCRALISCWVKLRWRSCPSQPAPTTIRSIGSVHNGSSSRFCNHEAHP